MRTKRLIAVSVSAIALMLAGCTAQELALSLWFSYYDLTSDVPALCPPPVIEREEIGLPGFGTMGRFDEAEELIVSAHEDLQRALGADHEHTRTAAEDLASVYAASG